MVSIIKHKREKLRRVMHFIISETLVSIVFFLSLEFTASNQLFCFITCERLDIHFCPLCVSVYDSPAKKRANKNLREILGVLLSDWLEFLIHIHAIFYMCFKPNRSGMCEGRFVLLKKEDACRKRHLTQDWSSLPAVESKGEHFVWELLPKFCSKSYKSSGEAK